MRLLHCMRYYARDNNFEKENFATGRAPAAKTILRHLEGCHCRMTVAPSLTETGISTSWKTSRRRRETKNDDRSTFRYRVSLGERKKNLLSETLFLRSLNSV